MSREKTKNPISLFQGARSIIGTSRIQVEPGSFALVQSSKRTLDLPTGSCQGNNSEFEQMGSFAVSADIE